MPGLRLLSTCASFYAMNSAGRLSYVGLLVVLAAGCGNDSEEGALDEDARAFESEAFDRAKAACGYEGTEADLGALEGQAETDADSCMFELCFGFSDCTLSAMKANPADGRELLECSERELEALIECCQDDAGSCTYASAEGCWDTVTKADPNLVCRFESIDSAREECEAEQSDSEERAGAGSASSDGLVETENADGSHTVETADGPVVVKPGDDPVVIETPEGVLLEVQAGDDGSFHVHRVDSEEADAGGAAGATGG
jgi:hypothetical protein